MIEQKEGHILIKTYNVHLNETQEDYELLKSNINSVEIEHLSQGNNVLDNVNLNQRQIITLSLIVKLKNGKEVKEKMLN